MFPAIRHTVLITIRLIGVNIPQELPLIHQPVTIVVSLVIRCAAGVETVINFPAVPSATTIGVGVLGVCIIVVLLEVGVPLFL